MTACPILRAGSSRSPCAPRLLPRACCPEPAAPSVPPLRRDRSSSAPRSVEFRVEIGPVPHRDRSGPGSSPARGCRCGARALAQILGRRPARTASAASRWGGRDRAQAGKTGSPPHCMGPVSPAWPGRSPAPAPLGCGRAASCGLRPVRAGTSTYLPNTNVPFSHPSEVYPQKDGRKVRSRGEGTFTWGRYVHVLLQTLARPQAPVAPEGRARVLASARCPAPRAGPLFGPAGGSAVRPRGRAPLSGPAITD
mgnify:CR=1 FL=1